LRCNSYSTYTIVHKGNTILFGEGQLKWYFILCRIVDVAEDYTQKNDSMIPIALYTIFFINLYFSTSYRMVDEAEKLQLKKMVA